MTDTDAQSNGAGEATPVEPSPRKLPFRIVTLAELLDGPDAQWLVDKVLPRPGLVVLFGSPSVGKTFVAFDVALSVAAEIDAFGFPTEHGPVLYIASEGRRGLKNRLRAWQTKSGVDAKSLPFGVMTAPVDVLNPDVVAPLVEHVQQAKPALIVIDTLARCFGDGDENAARDMNAFVDACSNISAAADATVLVVHHAGHEGGRARGSSALNGAADTMIRLTAGQCGTLKLTCTKQKDGPPFEPIELSLDTVALDETGDRNSCVVRVLPAREPPAPEPIPRPTIPKNARRLLEVLAAHEGGSGLTSAELLSLSDVPRSSIHESLKRLEDDGHVTVDKSQPTHVASITDLGRDLLKSFDLGNPSESRTSASGVRPSAAPKGGRTGPDTGRSANVPGDDR